MNVTQLANHLSFLNARNETVLAVHEHKLDGHTLVSLAMNENTDELNALKLKVSFRSERVIIDKRTFIKNN